MQIFFKEFLFCLPAKRLYREGGCLSEKLIGMDRGKEGD